MTFLPCFVFVFVSAFVSVFVSVSISVPHWWEKVTNVLMMVLSVFSFVLDIWRCLDRPDGSQPR